MNAIVADVTDHTDDLPPRALHTVSNSPADCGGGFAPELARDTCTDHRDRSLLVDVCPGEVTTSQDRVADRTKKSGTCEFIAADRRELPLTVGPVLHQNRIAAVVAVHRNCGGEGGRGD